MAVQARRDPGGGVREHALRISCSAARARRTSHRGRLKPTPSSAPRSPRSPLFAQRQFEKKREFLSRAGDAAQAAYANASAIEYFERLLRSKGKRRVEVLAKLGKVLELTGNWKRAEEVHTQALDLAARSTTSRRSHRARPPWRRSRASRAASTRPSSGSTAPRSALQRRATRAASGLVKHLTGTLAAQRGDYEKAVANYEASLAIRERVGDKVEHGRLAVQPRHRRRISRRL